jgi:hypothetical protein
MLAGRSLLAQIQSQGCCLEVDWTLLLAAVMVFFGEFFDAFSLDSILRAGFFENYYKIMIKLVKRREIIFYALTIKYVLHYIFLGTVNILKFCSS